MIQQLVTLESKLRKKKSRLLKKRDRLTDIVASSGEISTSCHVTPSLGQLIQVFSA